MKVIKLQHIACIPAMCGSVANVVWLCTASSHSYVRVLDCVCARVHFITYSECFGVADAAVLVPLPLWPDSAGALGCELCPPMLQPVADGNGLYEAHVGSVCSMILVVQYISMCICIN